MNDTLFLDMFGVTEADPSWSPFKDVLRIFPGVAQINPSL